MPIRFLCPSCRSKLSIGRRKSGETIACPKCQAPVIVPPPVRFRPAEPGILVDDDDGQDDDIDTELEPAEEPHVIRPRCKSGCKQSSRGSPRRIVAELLAATQPPIEMMGHERQVNASEERMKWRRSQKGHSSKPAIPDRYNRPR